MRYLIAFFICAATMAQTTNSFEPYRMVQRRPAPLAAVKARGITNGITLGQVVAQLGPGWTLGYSGTGMIRWSFSDGRELFVWPGGDAPTIVLSNDVYARSRFSFRTSSHATAISPK